MELALNKYCKQCAAPLGVDMVKVYELSVFCPNPECTEFVKSFWVEK